MIDGAAGCHCRLLEKREGREREKGSDEERELEKDQIFVWKLEEESFKIRVFI